MNAVRIKLLQEKGIPVVGESDVDHDAEISETRQ